MVVCHYINKGRNKNPELMEFMFCLYYILFEHGMECKAIYLPSAANVQVDAILHFDFCSTSGIVIPIPTRIKASQLTSGILRT